MAADAIETQSLDDSDRVQHPSRLTEVQHRASITHQEMQILLRREASMKAFNSRQVCNTSVQTTCGTWCGIGVFCEDEGEI